jgi:hypothetical protein
MARNLYRCYLYGVLIALLVFSVFVLETLLAPLLQLTPLRGTGVGPPTTSQLVQATVFAAVALPIIAALAGFHYWLIRRDLRADPAAGGSAIRAFFLNLAEWFIGLYLMTVVSGLLPQLGTGNDLSGSTASSLSLLALLVLLECERRRTKAAPGAALTFQRLHFVLLQLIILLIPLNYSWGIAGDNLLRLLLARAFPQVSAPCGGLVICTGSNWLALVVTALWFLLAWLFYGWQLLRDGDSLLRRLLFFGSLGYGLWLILMGLQACLNLLLKWLLGVSLQPGDILAPPAMLWSLNPLSALSGGLVIAGVCWFWLQRAARSSAEERARERSLRATAIAIAAALTALCLWWGLGSLLFNSLESLFPSGFIFAGGGSVPARSDWAYSLALFLVGLPSMPLDLILERRSRQAPAVALTSRWGFIFILIATAVVALAIGSAFALYAWITAMLGSPLEHWPYLAHQGLTAFLTGLVMLVLYLWRARREHLPASMLIRRAPHVEQPQLSSIEDVLDALLARRISRDEAARSLRSMMHLDGN